MTISSLLPEITHAISELQLDGISIRDIDGISPTFQGMANVFYPNPEGFISGFSVGYDSYDRGASSLANLSYTLNYRFLGTLIGDMTNMPRAYAAMIDNLLTVLNGLVETPAPYDGRVELAVGPITVGAKPDPAGNMFHGADVALRITEMQNA
jgi:hypothetical protein